MAKIRHSLYKRMYLGLLLDAHRLRAEWPKLLVLSLTSTLIFMILLEGSARIAWHYKLRPVEDNAQKPDLMPDPLLHHKWRPNLQKYADGIATNEQSWLERYKVQPKKPRGVYRIFFLGDSTTAGLVPYEQKMVKIVERRLNELYADRGIRIEAVNTGTSSYAIMQYYLLAKDVVLAFAPDLVVIDVDMTDLNNDYYYRTTAAYDAEGFPIAINTGLPGTTVIMTPFDYHLQTRLEKIKEYLVKKSRFMRYFDYLVQHGAKTLKPQRARRYSMMPANWLALHYSSQIHDNIKYSMRLLGRAIKILRANNVKVVVTGAPHYPQYTGEWSAEPHRILEETAKKYGALYLNSYTALKPLIDGSRPDYYYRLNDPTHFNANGNAIWADVQFDFLRQSGYLP